METTTVLITDIIELLPVLVKVFGAGSDIVAKWANKTGLTEAQLLDQAEQINAETRAAAQAHIDAMAASK